MSDHNTVVTRRSWLQRMSDSLIGIVVGILLVLLTIALLWWNEGRSAWRIETLSAGRGAVVSVASDKVAPENAKKLIHISGGAKAPQPLTDAEFGISADALRLNRIVEMFQWKESRKTDSEKNTGGSETTRTVYSYKKVWSDQIINSSSFHNTSHRNPGAMPFKSRKQTAKDISVGAFGLSAPFTGQISGFEDLPITDAMLANSATAVREKLKRDGNLLVSGNSSDPQIGDIRVTIQIVPPGPVSAIGKQTGNKLQPYTLPKGSIAMLDMGEQSAEAMFTKSESENTILTWILRIVGFFLMWIGLILIVQILTTIADIIPMVGNIVGAATAAVMGLLALALCLGVIGLAWLYYRPLIGIAVLLAAAAITYFTTRISGTREPAQQGG